MSLNGNGHGPLRVLIVEDNKDDVELIALQLQKFWKPVAWYDVQTEAALLVTLRRDTYDVILCDYVMPHLTALRALEVIRDTSQTDVPFIVISGTITPDSELEVLKRGAHDFVRKEEHARLIWAIKRELRRTGERMKERIKLSYSYDMTIEAWGMALELRDPYTYGHTRRVADITLRMARMYDVPHDEFLNIHRGALLHDIGKMGVPDNILLKPGLLTDEERAVINTHPTLAFQMLSHIPFLKDALAIPHCHHEKWNGTGYPRGLKGEEIPFEARLFSCADVFDAVTSSRPYRDAVWEKDRALLYIESEKGKSFDPAVADKFIEMMKST